MTWLAFRWRVQGLRLLACNVYWNAISGTHTQAHRMGACCTAIFLYADDVVFWHHLTVHCMQSLVNVCMTELQFLDMADNTKKSACMRFGSRYTSSCGNVVIAESPINWVTSARYLGVYLESAVRFKCSFANNKAKFFKAFNNIFGKVGRNASEEYNAVNFGNRQTLRKGGHPNVKF